MIKLFTLFNLVGLFLFNLLFIDDVRISQDVPARIMPGTEVRVTVTIDKANIIGFAKLQIDLPPGLSARAIDTRGASFTFADNKAKFIWMALPGQASFKVSYTLTADAGATGIHPVTARLSYIQDNERKTVDAAAATITFGDAQVAINAPSEPQAPKPMDPVTEETAQAEEAPAVEPPSPSANDLVSAAPAGIIPDLPVTDLPDLPAQAGPGEVTATRKVTQMNESELLVEVTIKKGALRGFGKLQENIPAGFTSIEKGNDDAIFSMTGRMLKFVWLNMPSKSELKVAYRLLAPAGADGVYTINGEFGYLYNDLTQRAVVGSSSFTMDGFVAVAEERPETPAPVTPTPTQPVVDTPAPVTTQEPKPVTPVAEPATPVATTPKATPATRPEETTASTTVTQPATPRATTTPAPETGITYKVQITAAHREVGKPYFIQRHNFHGDFNIERHEGWIKYVTGKYDQYRAARDQRQSYIEAQYKFPGPFVTAYNNGERITVQEALMISKQQWVQ